MQSVDVYYKDEGKYSGSLTDQLRAVRGLPTFPGPSPVPQQAYYADSLVDQLRVHDGKPTFQPATVQTPARFAIDTVLRQSA